MSVCARIEARPRVREHSKPLTRSLDTSEEKAPMKTTRTCSVDGCERGGKIVRGWCRIHYERWRLHGTTDLPTTAERLAAGLERKPNGCLEWTGCTDDGYGRIGVDGKHLRTHRVAWGLAHPDEPLPPAVRHYVCDNPPCCDPEHLRAGTRADNNADKAAKGRGRGALVNLNSQKTHCPRGHLYDDANTLVTRAGRRRCRACHRAAESARRAKAHS